MLAQREITEILLEERTSLMAFLLVVTRGGHHLVEDVFQDVCVKAISHEGTFESAEHLLNWARLTGRNRAINLLRARDGHCELLSEGALDTLAAAWPESRTSPLRERREALRLCLQGLTPNNREILRLRYFEGRSAAEVAQMLGRKLETVYQALSRIHKALGECIRARMAEWEGGHEFKPSES